MSDYLDRVVYEVYAQKHHEDLMQLSEKDRVVREAWDIPENDQKENRSGLGFQLRVAYIVAIIFLATLLITQVVVAAINGGNGGGPYLVR